MNLAKNKFQNKKDKSIFRVPENDTYELKAEAVAYTRASSRTIFTLIEKSFVRWVLKKYGHLSNVRVLDLGTGPGWIPVMLAQARPNWDITAVDLSPSMLEIARAHAEKKGALVNWVCASAEKTELPSHSFDLVIGHFSFHEFPDPHAVLKEMDRVTATGGAVLMRDVERPLKILFPLIRRGIQLFYRKNPIMCKQLTESLKASYTPAELADFFKTTSFQPLVSSKFIYGLQLWQAHGVKRGKIGFKKQP